MTNEKQPLERRAGGRRRVAAITLAAAFGATAGTAALTHELVPGSTSTTATAPSTSAGTSSSTTTGTTSATTAQAPTTSSGSGVTTSGGS